jgi:hypothetical protein
LNFFLWSKANGKLASNLVNPFGDSGVQYLFRSIGVHALLGSLPNKKLTLSKDKTFLITMYFFVCEPIALPIFIFKLFFK